MSDPLKEDYPEGEAGASVEAQEIVSESAGEVVSEQIATPIEESFSEPVEDVVPEPMAMDSEPEYDSQTVVDAEPVYDSQTVVDAEPVYDSQTVVDAEPVYDSQTVVDAEPVYGSQTVVDSEAVVEGEVVSDSDPDVEELPPQAAKYVGSVDDYDEESHVQGSSITQKLLRQAELEKEFKKSNRKGRAWSILLMLSLVLLSIASLGLLIRTGIQVVTYYSADAALSSESLTGFIEDIGGVPKPVENFVEGLWNVIHSVSIVVGVLQWIILIVSLLITILLLRKISQIAKKQSVIHEELVMLRTAEQPHVRRFWYVLLAWLFGNFGLHFFMTDQKKRGVIFIVLGILGLWFWPISLYTMSVSFYDGMASLYLPKEDDKKVRVIVGTGIF